MAEAPYRKDFFISYNHRDREWAEWIAWELEKSGYTVGIQAWDFGAGSNFVVEMDKALRDAQRVIAVLSPNYLESGFTASEWATPFANDPKGRDRKLIPIRVQEVDVDGLLGQIVYIDLVGKDEKAAKAELLRKLRENRGKPTQKPKFPASKRAAFPGTESNSCPQRSVRFEMVLSGTIEEVNKSRVEAVVRHLQNLLDDPDLTLQEIRNGSIVLQLWCSQAGYDRLMRLRKSGQLNEVMGFPVEDIRAPHHIITTNLGPLNLPPALRALAREFHEAAAAKARELISLLEDEDLTVRERAANELGRIGPAAESAVPALITLLQGKNTSVREHAADALGRIGRAAESAVPMLVTLLQDENTSVREHAAFALGGIGPAAQSAVPALINLLQDKDANIRTSATYALGKIGPAAGLAVPALITLLQGENASVRKHVGEALKLINRESPPDARTQSPTSDRKAGPPRR